MENYFNLKIFSGLPNDVIERIILTAEERKYQTGEIIMMEGEESNGEGYIIKSGSVKITIQ
ncbi:MAG: cyclic nucleotide-binding domain-containing protein [Candidatus Peribacteria bacterium]|nr:MAG: cyclic nucleotide-binding domain-containing protein [Candidatus Peribacteria bacterium]